jgi:hypothetical protein
VGIDRAVVRMAVRARTIAVMHAWRQDVKRIVHRIGVVLVSLLLAESVLAAAGEKAESAARAASSAATKTEKVVKRGLSAAASGVERGAKAAGNAATGVAKKIGVPGAGASAPKQPQSSP